ncbi:unnamed protein product [Echinostoma caproni]|uniref:Armadillo repeat-containing domain-containing protein n=1 Tax=Echinostoma caproni TaxID=27848 RepID=A0A3P8L3Q7_9TREM|nr:unnamed protein product [Echinostoma caproni]
MLDLLQQSSNPCSLEATSGILQNVTAGNWSPAQYAKKTIRILHGLPILTELLNAPSPRIVLVTANALRNLATDERCSVLLGKHAIQRIISALNNCTTHVPSLEHSTREANPEWQMPTSVDYHSSQSVRSSVYGTMNDHIPKKLTYSVTSALLQLCAMQLVAPILRHTDNLALKNMIAEEKTAKYLFFLHKYTTPQYILQQIVDSYFPTDVLLRWVELKSAGKSTTQRST